MKFNILTIALYLLMGLGCQQLLDPAEPGNLVPLPVEGNGSLPGIDKLGRGT